MARKETENGEELVYFPTYGVHNPPELSPVKYPDGIYPRAQGEPSNPTYPVYWCAEWTMYRVFGKNYGEYLPPYDGKPPAGLKEGEDYEVSYGKTFYDSTYVAEDGSKGAMMEMYDKRSLPIFPIDNKYTSAFISLGNNAYYLTWDDRPKGMPKISRFSNMNHPPRRDFIKHLPYSWSDSAQLNGRIQGYSFWTSSEEGQPPVQTGVSPNRTNDGCIMFGYGFESAWRPDDFDKEHEPYRHPSSFYFSGVPVLNGKLFAPMVSQNYTRFVAEQPDPALTWDLVKEFADGKPIEFFNPFEAFENTNVELGSASGCPMWNGKRS